jgi:hypothetical protein
MRRPLIEKIARKFIGRFLVGERTRDIAIANLAGKKASHRRFWVERQPHGMGDFGRLEAAINASNKGLGRTVEPIVPYQKYKRQGRCKPPPSDQQYVKAFLQQEPFTS